MRVLGYTFCILTTILVLPVALWQERPTVIVQRRGREFYVRIWRVSFMVTWL